MPQGTDKLLAGLPDQGVSGDMLSSLPDQPQVDGSAWVRASQYKPDAWAEAKRRADRLGIAPEIVERNPAEVSRLELRQSLDKMRRENPSLADWLMRDDNLTVAQDDIESLGFIDRMFNAGKYAARRVPALAGSLAGTVADISERAGDKLTLTMPQWLRGNKNLTDNVIRNERQVEPLFQLADWLKSFDGDQQGMTTFGDVKGNPLNAPSFVAEQVVASAPDMAAAVAALPAYVLSRTGEIANTRAVNDGRTEVTSSDYAAALPAALLEATFERFATSRLFKAGGGGSVVRRIGKEVAVQAGTEGAEEGFSNLGETVGTKSGFNLQQFADAVGAGALVGAGLGGTIEGTKSAFEQYHDASQARQRGQHENEQVDTLTKIVQQSKTWQRDPAKMENAIASLKGAGMENVYLPGEAVMTLYQSSPEMAQVFEAAGVSRDKVNESILTGADLSVPMETYLTRIAPQYHGELGKSARLSPDTITEADPDATDEQNAAVERFLASVNEAPPEGDADMRVYNDVLGQLLGTYSQADAEVMAGVVNGMFRDGIARRAGVDPMELYQRYGLRVVDEMKRRYPPDRVHPEFDADLERLRTGDIPTEDVALGPTIGEFLSERGIRSAPNEPMSGEIRRLNENDRFTRAGRRRLVREDDPNALTLDYAREAAVEAGYLPEGSDINDLLDALENDARPISPANPNAQDTRLRLTSLADELARHGLDVNALSNGEVRRALMGGVATDPNMMNFDQSGDAAFTESDYRPEVVSWAREKFGEMVAPNGRPAWQNFVAWFGDSKVVDADGKPLVVYHGTGADFDAFSEQSHRSTLNDKYQGDGFHFSADPRVASQYADAARNQVLNKDRAFAAVNREMPPKAAAIFREVVEDGYAKAWDKPDAEVRAIMDESEAAGIDLNELLDIAEWVEGSNYNKGRDARDTFDAGMIFGGSVRYLPEWVRNDAVKLGIADALPNPSVMPVYLKAENVLRTEDPDAAKRAQADGYDGVYYTGPGTVNNEPEWIVFRPEQIKSATANQGNFDPSNPSILNQPAYHGTPHTVDRFSLQKIGTGEGAQAYGWGLYFASEKAIAEHYRMALSDRLNPSTPAQMLWNHDGTYSVWEHKPGDAMISLAREGLSRDEAAALVDEINAREKLTGNLYRVEVPEDSDLLDYDKPMSQNPPAVRERAKRVWDAMPEWWQDEVLDRTNADFDDLTGAEFYQVIGKFANEGGMPGEFAHPDAFDRAVDGKEAASHALFVAGIPGLRYLDGNSRNAGEGSHNYVIWDESAISEPTRLAQQRRGYLQFGADRQFTIGLTEARNLSTFMHEIGHLGLEVMSDMAATDPVFAEEFGILTRWWQDNADAVIATSDREVRDTINAAGGADFLRMVAADFRGDYDKAGVAAKTALHEYFARGFERYLAEGKPPTPELARPFSRFKAWLKAIYKSLVNLNVELNDEVRGVMARMLAGDEAVVQAEQASVAEPLFKEASRAGMTEAQFAAYLELQAKAHDDAEARVTAEAYREVMREQERWWREESARVEGEVRAEFHALPVYRAWEALARNRNPDGTALDTPHVKLSADWLRERYGQEFMNKNLLRRQVYAADGGVHGDVIAPVFGFENGAALVEALANATPLSKAIRAETQARMRERHGDMRNDGTLPEKAMRAVHNTRRMKVIEAEIAALARLAGEPDMTTAQARKWAQERIAGKRVREITPYQYLRAERKAAREALRAANAGKPVEALAAARRKLANAVMYDEASKARDRFERRSKWIKQQTRKTTQERLGKAGVEYRDQVNGLLAVAGVREMSETEQARQKPLRAFVERLQEQGEDTAVTEAVLALSEAGRPVPMRDMTVGQFNDLHDALRNLKHLALNEGKLLASAERATVDQAVGAMVERAAESHPDRLPEMLSRRDETTARRVGDRLRRIASELDRPENIIESLDGGESGPWHDFLWGALNGAENTAIGLRRRMGTALRDLRKSMPDGFMRSLDATVELPHGIGQHSRGTLVGIVLNTGNAQNLQRLRDGGIHVNGEPITLTDDQVQELRDLLTPDEARYVQGLWDAVNSLWPDISALQTEMSGIPPEKVEAQAFTAAGHAMRGGYWPLAYDHSKSDIGERQSDDDALRMMMGQGFSRATTPKGHTKARVEKVNAPLQLDFGTVMSRHLENVMTDLAYRKAVKDASRLLRAPQVKDAIINRLGKGAYDTLKGSVAYAVSANDMAAQTAQSWRSVVSKVVSNSAVSALAIRPDIALGNYGSALVQALDRVGARSLLRGMWALNTGRRDLTAEISRLSPFMAERIGMIDEDYRAELTKAQGKRGYGEAYRRVAMTLHRWADHDVARAAWWGRYQESLDAGKPQAEAIRLADKTIRQTQTASARKDVSAIERDPAFRESRMFMGPMFVILGRLRSAAKGEGATRTAGLRAASIMRQMFLAPALFMLLAGRWPEDDDDDGEIGLGEWGVWLAVNTLLFPAQTIPYVREAAAGIEAWATDRPINPRAAPTAQAAAGLAKASKSIFQNIENYNDTGEFDWYDMTRDLTTMAGPFTGIPAGQTRITTQTIEAIQDDPDREKTELARMALYGPPKK